MTWKTCKIHGDDKPGVWGCPECLRELREENKRMRHRIERLRGALKTASGWVWDGAASEADANEMANKLIEMAGDMEPPLTWSNAPHEGRQAALSPGVQRAKRTRSTVGLEGIYGE